MIKESGHWYDKDGEARHTILSAKGEPRPTTLRDAKKFGWYPSVTTVMKVLAAPELDRWKQQQVLMASLTLPRNPDETDEVYCARIIEDAFQQVSDAADLGTEIHKALELYFQNQPYQPEMEAYVAPVRDWVAKNNVKFLKHELRLVNTEVGYAGTTDALVEINGELHILDYKGLACDTPIFTTDGWKTMLDLQVGDYVFSPSGWPVKVKGKSGIHHRDCYKITFDDSSSLISDNVHLWQVNVGQVGYRKAEVVDTETLFKYKADKKIITIPVAKPIQLVEADLPIDPYLLGCWIGDGTRGRSEICISEKKDKIVAAFEESGFKMSLQDNRNSCNHYYIADGFRAKLLSLNIGNDKIIPEQYFMGSINQRLELLRGLMDTDGNWNIKRNQVQINLINDKLADQLVRLVASLGMRVYRTKQKGTGFGKSFVKDMVTFTPNEFNVFKLNDFNADKNAANIGGTGFSKRRAIRSIEKCEQVPTCCIEVDSEDAMFLAGNDFIPTHNSRKTKPDYKITPYSKEPMQISAYANIVGAKRGVNLYISTTEPGRIGEAFYDEETISREYEAFKLVVALWQHQNKYKPTTK